MIINVRFDTSDKSMAISKDGVFLDNIEGVSFYKNYEDDEKYDLSINQRESVEKGVIKTTSTYANELDKTNQTMESIASSLSEYLGNEVK